MSEFHIGRSFTGHHIEDGCPCPKGLCGLAIAGADPECPEHWFGAAKTIRQGHAAEDCPGQSTLDTLADLIRVGFVHGWDEDRLAQEIIKSPHLPRDENVVKAEALCEAADAMEKRLFYAVEAMQLRNTLIKDLRDKAEELDPIKEKATS